LDGTAKAVPEVQTDPVKVYTVAVPLVPVVVSTLLGSPTTAVDPFPAIATEVPNAPALAGRVSALGVLSVEPL
jgi:hypothetical protein